MSDANYNENARRILEGAGLLIAGESATFHLHKETHELDLAQIATFLLGERDAEGNLFRGYLPDTSELGTEVLVLKVKGDSDRHIFLGEDVDKPDSLSIEVRTLARTNLEGGLQETTLGKPSYVCAIHKARILSVRFETIDIDTGDGKKRLWAVVFEKEGGWFLRVPDNGIIHEYDIRLYGEPSESPGEDF